MNYTTAARYAVDKKTQYWNLCFIWRESFLKTCTSPPQIDIWFTKSPLEKRKWSENYWLRPYLVNWKYHFSYPVILFFNCLETESRHYTCMMHYAYIAIKVRGQQIMEALEEKHKNFFDRFKLKLDSRYLLGRGLNSVGSALSIQYLGLWIDFRRHPCWKNVSSYSPQHHSRCLSKLTHQVQ